MIKWKQSKGVGWEVRKDGGMTFVIDNPNKRTVRRYDLQPKRISSEILFSQRLRDLRAGRRDALGNEKEYSERI